MHGDVTDAMSETFARGIHFECQATQTQVHASATVLNVAGCRYCISRTKVRWCPSSSGGGSQHRRDLRTKGFEQGICGPCLTHLALAFTPREFWQPLKKSGEKWNAKQCHQREERSAAVRFSLHCEALRHFAPPSCCSAELLGTRATRALSLLSES